MPKTAFFAKAIKWLLMATALTPLVVSNITIYPFVFPKIVFYRILIEMAVVLALAYFLTLPGANLKELLAGFYSKLKEAMKNPVIVFLSLLLLIIFLNFVFAILSNSLSINVNPPPP